MREWERVGSGEEREAHHSCVELQYCLSHEVWEGYPEDSSDDNAMSE